MSGVVVLNQPRTDSDGYLVTRSVLMGQTDGGVFEFVPVTPEGHIEAAIHAPRLPFGSIHTESLTPVFQTDAVYGINASQVDFTISGSGGVDGYDSQFRMSTGTTIYSQAVLQSRKRLRYRAGQGSVCRFTCNYATPAAQSYQLAGIGHAEDGFYFGYEDTDFGIFYVNRGTRAVYTLTVTGAAGVAGNVTITLNDVAYLVAVTNSGNIQRTVWEISLGTYAGWTAYPTGATVVFVNSSAGATTGVFSFAAGATGSAASIALTKGGGPSTDTFIPQSTWNGDVMDGTASADNPTGELLDPTKGNVYQIGLQYLGFGAIIFQIEVSPGDGNNTEWVTVHTIKLPNTLTATSIGNPSLPFTALAYSAGSTTDLTVKVGSFAGFIEGQKRLHGPRVPYADIASGSTGGYTPAFTILNPRYYGGRSNQGIINILGIGVGSAHNAALAVFAIKNASLTGNPNFATYATGSMALVDNAATAVVPSDNSQFLIVNAVGASGSTYIPISDNEELTLQPGEWLSICIKTASGNATSVQITMNTREDQ